MAERESSILIVDDDAADRSLFERVLRDLGEITTLSKPDDVISFVTEHGPDIVVLDALLPGTSGLELCEKIKSTRQTRDTRVVMVTGVYLQEHNKRDALSKFKADGFLTKPFRAPELQRVVIQLLSEKTREPRARWLRKVNLPVTSKDERVELGFFQKLVSKWKRAPAAETLALTSVPNALEETPSLDAVSAETDGAPGPTELTEEVQSNVETTAVKESVSQTSGEVDGVTATEANDRVESEPSTTGDEQAPSAETVAETTDPGASAEETATPERADDDAEPTHSPASTVQLDRAAMSSRVDVSQSVDAAPPESSDGAGVNASASPSAVDDPSTFSPDEVVNAPSFLAPESVDEPSSRALVAEAEGSRLKDSGAIASPGTDALSQGTNGANGGVSAEPVPPEVEEIEIETGPTETTLPFLRRKRPTTTESESPKPVEARDSSLHSESAKSTDRSSKSAIGRAASDTLSKAFAPEPDDSISLTPPVPPELEEPSGRSLLETLTGEDESAEANGASLAGSIDSADSGTNREIAAHGLPAVAELPSSRKLLNDVPVYEEEDFHYELKRELAKCRRVDRPLTLILIQVADMRQIVEVFGQDASEPVLWHLAEQAVTSLRDVDVVGMMRSEQLIALTVFASERYGGNRVITRVRAALTREPFQIHDGLPPIIPKIRFGMSSFPREAGDVGALFERAYFELSNPESPDSVTA